MSNAVLHEAMKHDAPAAVRADLEFTIGMRKPVRPKSKARNGRENE